MSRVQLRLSLGFGYSKLSLGSFFVVFKTYTNQPHIWRTIPIDMNRSVFSMSSIDIHFFIH